MGSTVCKGQIQSDEKRKDAGPKVSNTVTHNFQIYNKTLYGNIRYLILGN